MNEIQFIAVIQKLIEDTKIWIAIVGFLGVVTGALITAITNFVIEWYKDKPRKELDTKRKTLLIKLLEDKEYPEHWRYLKTMAAVIGTNEEDAKRLLIEAGARGSEANDGRWGLIKHHPLETIEE